MINYVWLGLMIVSVLAGLWNNCIPEMVISITIALKSSIEFMISLSGMLIFWTGLLHIAQRAGLIEIIAYYIHPLLRYLFHDIPEKHPSFNSITLVLTANALGLSNAAIPFGIKAMEDLATLNKSDKASDAMCMLVTINASSVQLIPTSVIALLALYGSIAPTSILLPTTIASIISTLAGIFSVMFFRKYYKD